jgi:REP element-mobilizing transposase RayT
MNPEESSPRLKRFDRLYKNHPIYFVTACTENRRPIFAKDAVHNDFKKFCEKGLSQGVFVGKYVLMPDHLHLFVTFGAEYESVLAERFRIRRARAKSAAVAAAIHNRRLSFLSEWMKSLKNSLSKTLRQMKIPAPHWQKDFFDHVMRSEESYAEKWLYVAENPIRKNLATRAEDWPFQGEIYPLRAHGHV